MNPMSCIGPAKEQDDPDRTRHDHHSNADSDCGTCSSSTCIDSDTTTSSSEAAVVTVPTSASATTATATATATTTTSLQLAKVTSEEEESRNNNNNNNNNQNDDKSNTTTNTDHNSCTDGISSNDKDDVIFYPCNPSFHQLRNQQTYLNTILQEHFDPYWQPSVKQKKRYILEQIINPIRESGRQIKLYVSSPANSRNNNDNHDDNDDDSQQVEDQKQDHSSNSNYVIATPNEAWKRISKRFNNMKNNQQRQQLQAITTEMMTSNIFTKDEGSAAGAAGAAAGAAGAAAAADSVTTDKKNHDMEDLIFYPVGITGQQKQQTYLKNVIDNHWYPYSQYVGGTKNEYVLQQIVNPILDSGREIKFCVPLSSLPNNEDRNAQQQHTNDCNNKEKYVYIIPSKEMIIERMSRKIRNAVRHRCKKVDRNNEGSKRMIMMDTATTTCTKRMKYEVERQHQHIEEEGDHRPSSTNWNETMNGDGDTNRTTNDICRDDVSSTIVKAAASTATANENNKISTAIGDTTTTTNVGPCTLMTSTATATTTASTDVSNNNNNKLKIYGAADPSTAVAVTHDSDSNNQNQCSISNNNDIIDDEHDVANCNDNTNPLTTITGTAAAVHTNNDSHCIIQNSDNMQSQYYSSNTNNTDNNNSEDGENIISNDGNDTNDVNQHLMLFPSDDNIADTTADAVTIATYNSNESHRIVQNNRNDDKIHNESTISNIKDAILYPLGNSNNAADEDKNNNVNTNVIAGDLSVAVDHSNNNDISNNRDHDNDDYDVTNNGMDDNDTDVATVTETGENTNNKNINTTDAIFCPPADNNKPSDDNENNKVNAAITGDPLVAGNHGNSSNLSNCQSHYKDDSDKNIVMDDGDTAVASATAVEVKNNKNNTNSTDEVTFDPGKDAGFRRPVYNNITSNDNENNTVNTAITGDPLAAADHGNDLSIFQDHDNHQNNVLDEVDTAVARVSAAEETSSKRDKSSTDNMTFSPVRDATYCPLVDNADDDENDLCRFQLWVIHYLQRITGRTTTLAKKNVLNGDDPAVASVSRVDEKHLMDNSDTAVATGTATEENNYNYDINSAENMTSDRAGWSFNKLRQQQTNLSSIVQQHSYLYVKQFVQKNLLTPMYEWGGQIILYRPINNNKITHQPDDRQNHNNLITPIIKTLHVATENVMKAIQGQIASATSKMNGNKRKFEATTTNTVTIKRMKNYLQQQQEKEDHITGITDWNSEGNRKNEVEGYDKINNKSNEYDNHIFADSDKNNESKDVILHPLDDGTARSDGNNKVEHDHGTAVSVTVAAVSATDVANATSDINRDINSINDNQNINSNDNNNKSEDIDSHRGRVVENYHEDVKNAANDCDNAVAANNDCNRIINNNSNNDSNINSDNNASNDDDNENTKVDDDNNKARVAFSTATTAVSTVASAATDTSSAASDAALAASFSAASAVASATRAAASAKSAAASAKSAAKSAASCAASAVQLAAASAAYAAASAQSALSAAQSAASSAASAAQYAAFSPAAATACVAFAASVAASAESAAQSDAAASSASVAAAFAASASTFIDENNKNNELCGDDNSTAVTTTTWSAAVVPISENSCRIKKNREFNIGLNDNNNVIEDVIFHPTGDKTNNDDGNKNNKIDEDDDNSGTAATNIATSHTLNGNIIDAMSAAVSPSTDVSSSDHQEHSSDDDLNEVNFGGNYCDYDDSFEDDDDSDDYDDDDDFADVEEVEDVAVSLGYDGSELLSTVIPKGCTNDANNSSNEDVILYPADDALTHLREQQTFFNNIMNENWCTYSEYQANKKQYILDKIVRPIYQSGRQILYCQSSVGKKDESTHQNQPSPPHHQNDDFRTTINKLIEPTINMALECISRELRETKKQRLALGKERMKILKEIKKKPLLVVEKFISKMDMYRGKRVKYTTKA